MEQLEPEERGALLRPEEIGPYDSPFDFDQTRHAADLAVHAQMPTLRALWTAQTFVGDHPELPTADTLILRRHIHGGTADDRMRQLRDVADRYGADIVKRGGSAWVKLVISAGPVAIDFYVQTHGV